jgi:HlyD family secretion protein
MMGKIIRWLVGGVVVAAFGAMLWLATRPPPLTIQGEVSADRVDVSSRVAARAVALNADVGDTVEKGSLMAELDNPQLVAMRFAAETSLAVANADLDRISSTRPETIATRKAELESAKADEMLSQATYKRQIELARTGNTPQARVDEATRNLQMASRQRESAQAALELATTGASKEERALAAAQVKQAQAVLNQRDVDLDELVIHAPISGQVTTRVAAIGENFSAGAPLFSLIDMHNLWFTFNLREDLLGGLKIGDQFDVTVPALNSQVVPVRVTMINVQGQYAAWRATRATGDFDLRTFEVRALPIEPVDGLRPGMTAVAEWANRGR